MYNISWQRSSGDMVQKSMVVNETNYTISDLMPGQNYSVRVCAVREGYDPNCTETKEYSTTVPGELQTHCFMHVYLVSCQLFYNVNDIYSVSDSLYAVVQPSLSSVQYIVDPEPSLAPDEIAGIVIGILVIYCGPPCCVVCIALLKQYMSKKGGTPAVQGNQDGSA